MIYGNLTDWRAYATARGNSATTVASDADATAALQRASDYIRTRYALRLKLPADDSNVIEGTYIAAAYDIASPGFWQSTYTPAQAKALTRAGDIQWTVVKDDRPGNLRGADAQIPTSPAIEALFPGSSYSGVAFMVIG